MKRTIIPLFTLLTLSTGTFAAESGSIDGFGTDIPLGFAVEQIVPEKFSVSFGPGVDVAAPVSWRGGEDWKSVLSETLAERGLFVEFTDTDKARITVSPYAKEQTIYNGLQIAEYKRPQLGPRDGSYAADLRGKRPGLILTGEKTPDVAEVVAAPASIDILPYTPMPKLKPREVGEHAILIGLDFDEMAKPSEVWPVFKGNTLHGTLSDWAEKAGWTVQWDSSYSYPIMATAEFEGNFIESAGKLIEAMSRAEPPVQGEFFKGNKVLVMTTPAGRK